MTMMTRTRFRDQGRAQQQQQQQQDTANSTAAVAAVAAANNNNNTTRTVTLAEGFPVNNRTITIEIPSSASRDSCANAKSRKSKSMLVATGHHLLYLCFEEYGYRFSTANDSDGTIAFLCDRARHPRDNSAWISNVPAWYRLKKALGVSKNLNQCRCKGKLLVVVSKSDNRDWAFLTQPHECGGINNNNNNNDDDNNEEEEDAGNEVLEEVCNMIINNNDNDHNDNEEDGEHRTPPQSPTVTTVPVLDEISVSNIATRTLNTLKDIWNKKIQISSDELALFVEDFRREFVEWCQSIVARERAYPGAYLNEELKLGSVDEEADGEEKNDDEEEDGTTRRSVTNDDDNDIDDDKGDDAAVAAVATTTTPPSHPEPLQSYVMTPFSESSESDDDEGFCLNAWKDEEMWK